MKIRRFIYLFSIILAFGACDSRDDYFTESMERPDFYIINGQDHVEKVTQEVKLGYDSLYFDYEVANKSENEYVLKPHWSNGVKCILLDSVETKFRVVTNKTGIGEAKVICEDQYGQRAMVSVTLEIFENKTPVCKWEMEKLDDNWAKIDASGSYDKDRKWNGHIIQYQYKIGEYDQKTRFDYIRYNFVESGDYNVKVRVMDNDSTWSNWNLKTITL